MTQKVAKLVALYKEPENREDFDKQYVETHIPLIEKVPGLRGMEVYKPMKNMMGGENPYYMMATLTFDNMDALKAAMSSPEGQAAGANIMGFAGKLITLLTTEVAMTEGAALSPR